MKTTDVHLARLIAGVQKAGLDVHDIAHASGSADVLGYEVSPASSDCVGVGQRRSRVCSVARAVSSRRRISGRTMELVNGHEFFWHSATVVLSQSLTTASSSRGPPTNFQEGHGQLCVWNRELWGEFHVFSAVIGVSDCLMSASVPMHRKRAVRLRLVNDVVRLLGTLGVSRNGRGSGAVPGPSVPGRVRSVPSRQMSL